MPQDQMPARLITVIALLMALIVCGSAQAQTSPLSPGGEVYSYSPKQRVQDYLSRTVGPESLLNAALLSGIDQWRDRPEGWQQGSAGYGQRFGSRLGRTAIGNTIQLGVEAALQEDSRYKPLEHGSVGGRIVYVLSRTFTVLTPSGRRAPPVGRLAGIVGSAMISHTWYPEGENSWEDGARGAGISFGVHTGMNVFREFLPDIKRIFKR